MNRIELRNIELKFDDRILLKSGNIDIADGSIYPLLGLNGSGKTTCMRMLAGFIKPLAGSFKLDGELLYQPQKPVLFSMTVLENAMVGMIQKDEAKALELLADLGLADFAHAKAKSLSGGEQARLCLARSMLTGGDVLLLDEPFAAIDSKSADAVALLVKNYCLRERTTLIVTVHNVQTAKLLSERCLLIRDEKLVVSDTDAVRDYFIGAI